MNSSCDKYFLKVLKSEFYKRQKKNESFSLRSFAKFLSVHPGTLSNIFLGKRGLPENWSEKISEKLELSPKKRKAFVESVKNQKNSLLDPLLNSHQTEEERMLIEEIHFNILSEWEYYAFLSLMNTRDFKSDANWIATRLGISIDRANTVVSDLIQGGFIKEENKNLVRICPRLNSTNDIPSMALKKGHKENLELAVKKLYEVNVKLHGFFCETMAIDIDKLDQAKEIIDEFKGKLAGLLESGQKSEVYNLSIQLYPLTNVEQHEQKEFSNETA